MEAKRMTAWPRRWWALTVLCMGAFLSPLDFFIVNVALPGIRSGLHASAASLQLVIAGYGAAYAVCVVTGGRLGDMYGRKRVFIVGMVLFTLTSALCALAVNVEWLIAARVMQGMSAAMLAPQVLSTIRVIFPVAEQPAAMGIFGAVFGLAAIAGQLLGGMLIRAEIFGFTWESVFMINIPVGIITCITGMYILKENRPPERQQPDLPGMLLITAALLLFICPVILGREAHWPVWTFVSMALSAVAGVWFVKTEQRVLQQGGSPLIYLPLLRDPYFVRSLIIIFLYNHTAAFFLVYPYYLQNGLHWDALAAGFSVLPYAAGFFAGPLISPLLARRTGIYAAGAGQVLLSIGLMGAATVLWLDAPPGWALKAALFVAGIGHGIVMPSMVRLAMVGMEEHMAGQASGMVSTAIQVGSVLGVALLGTLFFALLDRYTGIVAVTVTLACLACIQCVALMMIFFLKSALTSSEKIK
ncbi:MFS transporter [Chitinophaga solisilvae]|uniref:MFS transporter n=1 Tax=Chitinophaga solisilvae TaxID=1233460 RepID=UPI00136B697F|nr:MFS transporter [Chitinophaga solisilvae]